MLHAVALRCPVLQRFAAVIMRIREPKTTALIFASGKMVCTGAKSEAESKLAAKKVSEWGRLGQQLGPGLTARCFCGRGLGGRQNRPAIDAAVYCMLGCAQLSGGTVTTVT